jgi:hypothetical protein
MRKFFPQLALLATLLVAMAMPALAQTTPAAPSPEPLAAFLDAVFKAAPVWVPLFNTFILPPLTNWAKTLPLPFVGATATGLIVALSAFATVTSVVCNFLIAWLSGNLASFDFANAGVLLGQVVTSVLTAAGAYGLWKKKATT